MNSAVFSEDGTHRYRLERHGLGGGYLLAAVNFVMLNPSTATADVDDPTVRRCMGFARAWGYDHLVVTNLFALCATDPRELRDERKHLDAVNQRYVIDAAKAAELVVCAWGAHGGEAGHYLGRLLRIHGVDTHALGVTADGSPRHPLYLRSDSKPQEWP